MKTMNGKTAARLAVGILIVLAAGCKNPLIDDLMKDKDERDRRERERLLTPPAPPPVSVPALAITALSIDGVSGVVNGTNRTVTVTLPLGTDLTNLSPAITHSGTGVSPPSGAPQDFYKSGFTPVTYTLTGTGGAETIWTVIVRLEPLAPGADIGDYLDGITGVYDGSDADHPVPLPVALTLDSAGWPALLAAINIADEYVALDLSACTAGTEPSGGGLYDDGTFDPGPDLPGTGKDMIVSLALPDAADGIAAGTSADPAFKNFTNLASVSGAGIAAVGGYAFRGCSSLKTVSLPAATTIGGYAFTQCTSLETVSLPAATTIGGYAFTQCTSLETVSLPAATSIGNSAFSSCTSLETVSLPAATTIGGYAFSDCSILETVDLPAAKTIGNQAFVNCTSLETVSLDAATGIGYRAFTRCTSLEAVSLPAAKTIGSEAFSYCAALETVSLPEADEIGNRAFSFTGSTALTVTLGSTAPVLGIAIFDGVIAAKTVTVRVPSGAAAWTGKTGSFTTDTATGHWGNAFRGKGWDGTLYLDGTVNSNITLTVTDTP
jgi:hypothetical protein